MAGRVDDYYRRREFKVERAEKASFEGGGDLVANVPAGDGDGGAGGGAEEGGDRRGTGGRSPVVRVEHHHRDGRRVSEFLLLLLFHTEKSSQPSRRAENISGLCGYL